MKKAVIILVSLLSISLFSQVPRTLSYQGRLTDSGDNPLTVRFPLPSGFSEI
jgi:hypothetical protein